MIFDSRKIVISTALLVSICALGMSESFAAKPGTPDLWTQYPSEKDRPSSDPTDTLFKAQSSFRELAKQLVPTVVNIYTTIKPKLRRGQQQQQNPFGGDPREEDIFRFFDEFFRGHPFLPPPSEEVTNLGSGFVINKEGYVVTNAHVVARADEIKVKLDDDKHNKKQELDAKVVGLDELMDVALLKVDKHPALREAPLGDSGKLFVGDWVLAIGNPLGHGHTLTFGVVSALGRDLSQINPYADFIQTDADINPGNSGGPLINIHGEVVGLNTAIDARGAGIGFAIPISSVKNILTQLKDKGKVSRGWIGIVIGPEIDEKWQKYFKVDHGIIVSDVIKDEPADKAGLQQNDVIVLFNNKKVYSARDILKFVAEVPVGEKVPVTIFRDGKNKNLTIQVAERKSDATLAQRTETPRKKGVDDTVEKVLGLSVVNIDENLRRKYQIKEDVQGVLVVGVQWNSPAHKSGIMEGDIIKQINRTPTPTEESFRSEIAKQASSKTLLLNVMRQDQALPILVELE